MADLPFSLTGDIAANIFPFGNGKEKFSFKRGEADKHVIGICPYSVQRAIDSGTNGDISWNFDLNGKKTPFQRLLDEIPCIRIREYAQDSKVQLIVNAFKNFWAGVEAAGKDDAKIMDALKNLPQKFNEIIKGASGQTAGIDASIELHNGKDTVTDQILKWVFISYYELVTAKTLGHYTLPFNGRIVDNSNGSDGWTSTGIQSLGTRGGANTFLGDVMNFIGTNISIDMTPRWGGSRQSQFPNIDMTFELFNDTVENAVNNFVFVNSIMAKNKYLQYGVYQHNPCIYDITIHGYKRFFMCTADMQCDYKGVSRTPSKEIFKRICSFVEKSSSIYVGHLTMETLKKLVKIPDVYSMKITLKSLLPNNLNNYLFYYSTNLTDGSEITEHSKLPDIEKTIEKTEFYDPDEALDVNSTINIEDPSKNIKAEAIPTPPLLSLDDQPKFNQ